MRKRENRGKERGLKETRDGLVFFGSVRLFSVMKSPFFLQQNPISFIVSGNFTHFLAIGCLSVLILGDVVIFLCLNRQCREEFGETAAGRLGRCHRTRKPATESQTRRGRPQGGFFPLWVDLTCRGAVCLQLGGQILAERNYASSLINS